MKTINLQLRTKVAASFLALTALTALTGATGLLFISGVGDKGVEIGEKQAPLVSAVLTVKQRATEAHLKFETLRAQKAGVESQAAQSDAPENQGASDREVELIEIWAYLDETLFYADTILDGGETEEGYLFASQSPIVRETMARVRKQILQLKSVGREKFVEDASLDETAVAQFEDAFEEFEFLADEAEAAIRTDVAASVAAVAASRINSIYILSGILAVSFALAMALAFLIGRSVVTRVRTLSGQVGVLSRGDLDTKVSFATDKDEIGEMARSLEQIRAVGVAAARAQSSLNDASSAMMIVDVDGTVLFANKKMTALAENLAASLAGELRGFADGAVTGVAFDMLHNVEAMQAKHLMSLDQSVTARMVAGGRTIDLTASPVFNEAGERLGAVVEWTDMTGQVAIEHEIAGIVHAAGQGEFGQRLNEDDKDGFMRDLARGMNELTGAVDRGLSETVAVMSALADGDLSKRMEGDYKGAFAQLKQDANSMADQIEMIAERISSVTGAVRGATREIASGIADLSARTEHQASSLEETTASMEELSSTVRQNADNAQEANQVSVAARDSADAGSAVAEKAVSAMGGIEESSRQITDIVGLIQEIAFQTNLLALNASVEAARAGDAGKGFAVVANEVRALAQRAATASKDIKELIVNSDNQVKAGVELVNQAGASLGEIVASVKKVADFVSEIAAASQEQSAGIDQVSNAITNMDEMTQQNASLVEETTAALTSAQTQLEDLRQAVGFFRTKQAEQAELREAGADDVPAVNPVAEQHRVLARRVSGGGAAAAVKADKDWPEF
ncbi:MAG: methyl-accepting chemotaxis protein [Hyphomicrobiales bacterium]|nr:methyl-accepting chemotaxis protein [Hyphomicrobiales bacterium]